MTSMVFHGDRTTKLRSLRPFEPLPPMTHFKNGKRTPAISRIEVKVFSNMSPATYNSKRQLGHKCQKHVQVINTFSSLNYGIKLRQKKVTKRWRIEIPQNKMTRTLFLCTAWPRYMLNQLYMIGSKTTSKYTTSHNKQEIHKQGTWISNKKAILEAYQFGDRLRNWINWRIQIELPESRCVIHWPWS